MSWKRALPKTVYALLCSSTETCDHSTDWHRLAIREGHLCQLAFPAVFDGGRPSEIIFEVPDRLEFVKSLGRNPISTAGAIASMRHWSYPYRRLSKEPSLQERHSETDHRESD